MHDTPVIKIRYDDQEVDQQFSAEAPVSDVIKFAKKHFKFNDAIAYSAYRNGLKLDAGLSIKRLSDDNLVIEVKESSASLRLKEPNATVATKMANEATERFPVDESIEHENDSGTISNPTRVDHNLVQVDKHLDNEPKPADVPTKTQPDKTTTTQPAKRKQPRKK